MGSVWTTEDGDHDVCLSEEVSPPDAAFIAAARTDLPLLLAVLRRVEGLADAWDAEARQAMANGLDAQAIAQDWCVNDLRRVIAPLLEPEP